jgi:hypothetical protein
MKMSKQTKTNHVHKYKRVNISRKIIRNSKREPIKRDDYFVFKCTKPLCTHYVPLNMAEGKMCECNRCGEPMILTKESMLHALPHCLNCIKRKVTQDDTFTSVAEFLEKNKI